jgi:hypothetical protein
MDLAALPRTTLLHAIDTSARSWRRLCARGSRQAHHADRPFSKWSAVSHHR